MLTKITRCLLFVVFAWTTAAPATVRSVLNNWFFLGGAIVLMVAVLGWALYRASRRLEGLPKE